MPNPMEFPEREGNWMQTTTGGRFYPLDPTPEQVNIEDIANALSMQCRYNGHVNKFYSVAEHCVLLSQSKAVRVSQYLAEQKTDPQWALMHDAAEAYVGDMVRPLKAHISEFSKIEDRILLAIASAVGLPIAQGDYTNIIPEVVREADARILLDEKKVILASSLHQWDIAKSGLEPLGDVTIEGWTPPEARVKFLERFEELFQ